MLTVNVDQLSKSANGLTAFPLVIQTQPDRKLDALLANLSPDVPWMDRQIAAQELGDMYNPEALPGLLAALPIDPFWMVRCAIIQALERIGDLGAIPTLQDVAEKDGFQIVRSYAVEAIQRLSHSVSLFKV